MTKKMILVVLLVSLAFFVTSFAYADTAVFAFEDAEYSLFVGKSIKVKTVAQNISGKLTYDYASSDETIATIKNGSVKGLAKGNVTITCTATDKDGNTYTATCLVNVNVPIKSIKANENKVTIAPAPFGASFRTKADEDISQYHYVFKPEIMIEPEDATFQTLEWSSAKPSVASVTNEGLIFGGSAGTTTVTGKATDGSGKSVKIEVTVPKCYVTEKNITISEPSGTTLGYVFASSNGINMYNMKISGNVISTKTLEEENGLDMMKIIPLKAGSGTITFTRNGSTVQTVKIKVEHSAVYDKVSYPPVSVASLLAASDESIGIKTQVTCKVVDIQEDKELGANGGGIVYALVEEKGERQYAIFEYANAMKLELEQEYTIYGEVSDFVEYNTDTGLVYTAPYFKNSHINW